MIRTDVGLATSIHITFLHIKTQEADLGIIETYRFRRRANETCPLIWGAVLMTENPRERGIKVYST